MEKWKEYLRNSEIICQTIHIQKNLLHQEEEDSVVQERVYCEQAS